MYAEKHINIHQICFIVAITQLIYNPIHPPWLGV